MKVNEFLKSINGVLKLELPDDVLSNLGTDLPDGFETRFTESYLTRERAKSDDEIITEITKKSNKKAFTEIDEQIKELLPLISLEDKQKIDSVFSTPEKLKLLKPAIDSVIKSTKGKLTPDDIRKVEDEWSGKYKTLQETSKAEKEQLARQMEDKNLDFYITQKASGYNLVKEFLPARESINQMLLLNLKTKGYKFEFENGAIAVRQEKDGVVRDVFDGETKVTLESLTDKFMTPFIAKSNQTPDLDSLNSLKKDSITITGSEDLRSLMLASAGK